ncbi:MAG: DegT/DnrJ/EryC1/StrS family aminotransferase [Syntrophomonadaceae bacterium]|nr:DegT/DnrJ/EryC1/StrS family aminotransferase [Syntrophomonadaceae bacterium]
MLDLVNQYNQIKPEIDSAIAEVLASGEYILGSKVQEFEQNIAEFLGAKYAIGVASGSDALLLSLHALGIGKGDEVIVPTFTFFATAGAVSRLGAIPVFVDIDPITYNMDLNQVEEILKKDNHIKAVIPVHLFGLPIDMNRLMKLTEEYNLYVVEDACQAINADIYLNNTSNVSHFTFKSNLNNTSHVSRLTSNVQKAGTIGHTGCFSFFPSKNLGCYGDGGMVVTNDDGIAEKIRVLRVHGSKPKYHHSVVGYNSRLDSIQAAILNVKLKYLNKWTQKRWQVASIYNKEFEKLGLDEILQCPEVTEGHVFHQYVIQVDRRDELATYLKGRGIATAVYYPLPLHLQECFRNLGYQEGDLPVAEKTCKKVLALPIDPELTEEEIRYVVKSINEFINK